MSYPVPDEYSWIPMTSIDLTRHPEAERYTGMAQILHWIVVALLIVQFTLAWTMPDIRRNTEPEALINLHLSFGLVILLVMAVRLIWRLTHPAPPPPNGLPAWQLLSSRVVHGLLYALLFVIPVLGWMNASYRGWDVTLFGFLHMPNLVPPRSATPMTSPVRPLDRRRPCLPELRSPHLDRSACSRGFVSSRRAA